MKTANWLTRELDGKIAVQSPSHVHLFATPWTAARQASLSITNSRSLLKLMSVELVMPSNHLILCHPLLLPASIFPSIKVFSNESALCIRWPKYWSFSFSISPSNEYSRLISFGIDWFDLWKVTKYFWNQLSFHVKSFIHHLGLCSLMASVTCQPLWYLMVFRPVPASCPCDAGPRLQGSACQCPQPMLGHMCSMVVVTSAKEMAVNNITRSVQAVFSSYLTGRHLWASTAPSS